MMPPSIESKTDHVLTCDEVATILRVSEHTIKNLHRTHQLRAVKIGRHNRWRPNDVIEFVENLKKCDDLE